MKTFKELKEMKRELYKKSKNLQGKSKNLACKAVAFRLVILEQYSKAGLDNGKLPVEWNWFSKLRPLGMTHEWYLEQFRNNMRFKNGRIEFKGFLKQMNKKYELQAL